jgi:AraC-like DNA-binding protein
VFVNGATAMVAHSLPGVYTRYLVELVKRWGVTADDLLAGSGVNLEALSDPQFRIPIPVAVEHLERARALTSEPALGFYLGTQMRLSAHGALGMAALSAASLREAIELSIRFIPIVTTALGLRLRVEGQDASLIIEEFADFGSARDIVLISVLVSFSRISWGMTRQRIPGQADLALPEPPYYGRLMRLGVHIRFNQPVHRLLVDAGQLALPYVMADPIALERVRNECERILDSIRGATPTTAQVRSLMNRGKGSVPTLAEVATALHLSGRTLKRQLAAEGTSFSALLDEERRERAILLLQSRTVPLKKIAGSLGYSNVANFSRAFLRWTGRRPSEQRHSDDASLRSRTLNVKSGDALRQRQRSQSRPR